MGPKKAVNFTSRIYSPLRKNFLVAALEKFMTITLLLEYFFLEGGFVYN